MKTTNKNVEMLQCNTSTKNKKGFTLVELIIVITILAILATIAFISFRWYTSNSRDGNRLATLKNLESGLELYSLKTSKYPTPENITWTWVIWTETLVYVWEIGDNISRNINMSKTPKDPLSNNNYVYGTDTNYSYYQIATVLENWVSYAPSPGGRGLGWGIEIIPTTYADNPSYQAHVIWNYTYPLKKWTKLYSLPSLIFTWTWTLELNSTWFVVNKWTNTPYKLNTNQTENTQTIEDVLKIITWTWWRTLTWITLTNWDTNSWSLAQTFFGTNSVENIDKVWISYYWVNKYITEIKTSWDGETTPITPTYSCTWALVTANANITNTTWLTADTPYQTSNSSNSCYYTCKTWYWEWNCQTNLNVMNENTCQTLAWWIWVDATTDTTTWTESDWYCISPRFWDWNSDSATWNWWISWNGWWYNSASATYNWWNGTNNLPLTIRDSWEPYTWQYWQTRTLDSLVSYDCKAIWTVSSDIDTTYWDTYVWRMKWIATTWNFYDQATSISWIVETWTNTPLSTAGWHAIPALFIADCIDGVKDLWTDMPWVPYSDYSTDVTVSTDADWKTNTTYQKRQAYLLAWTKKKWSHLPSAYDVLSWGDAWSWVWEYEIACSAWKFWTYTTINQSSQNDQEAQERIWLASVGGTTGTNWGRSARIVGYSGCASQYNHDTGNRSYTNSARFVVR